MNDEATVEALRQIEGDVRRLREELEAGYTAENPLFTSRIAEMPKNQNPDQKDFLARAWFDWPVRVSDPEGVTIHHTLSHSPEATARYCTNPAGAGGKGYPTVQYHFWVSAGDGCPVWQLVPLHAMLWHDNTGAYQKTLSVGMAGSLHVAKPPQEQLEAAARLVAWLMHEYDIGRAEVQGHCDRWSGTVCPGWYKAGWHDAFYKALMAEYKRGLPEM